MPSNPADAGSHMKDVSPLPTIMAQTILFAMLPSFFQSVLDLAIARNIRLGGGRNLQLRVDMFNAPNAASPSGSRLDDHPGADTTKCAEVGLTSRTRRRAGGRGGKREDTEKKLEKS